MTEGVDDPLDLAERRPGGAASFEELLRSTLNEPMPMPSPTDSCAKVLGNITVLIGNRFEADVCSIYRLEQDDLHLVLAATVGLRQDSIGQVRMRLDEGLVGLVAQEFRPIAVEEAASHPRFKYFPNAGEDPYHSFLGVPAIHDGALQGVLTIQTIEPRTFSRQEMARLISAGQELAAILRTFRGLHADS